MYVLLLAACSNQAVYTGESFAIDSPFKMKTDSEVTLACESARRALLGQGYLIENADGDGVKARKAYRSEDKQNTFIEMNIVCLPETPGSTLFANGLLTGYEVKKSASSASVGVSALGSISLPIGQSADSLVKVSEETINDKNFYQRFFAAVGNILSEREASRALHEPEAEPVEPPEPAPVLAPPAPAAEPSPSQIAPPAVPEKSPAQAAPETVPEPLPAQQAPAVGPELPPAKEVPEIKAKLPPAQDAPEIEVLEPIPAPTTTPKESPTLEIELF